MKKMTKGRIAFQIINYTVLTLLALICLFPLLNILAMSFSSATAVSAGRVLFFPVEFNTYAYNYVIEKREFWQSLLKSVERVCIGVPFTMLITILVAYPLSKESTQLRLRGVYAWIFFFTMLFSGGLIPGYLLIQNLHMMDTIWALILPLCLNSFNIIVLRTFFKTSIPDAVIESAKIDGASEWRVFFQIVIPMALPGLATIGLFLTLGYWNDWFNAMMYMDDKSMIPLQYLLIQIESSIDWLANNKATMGVDGIAVAQNMPKETIKMAIVVISTLPIIFAYPFFQRYFVNGLTVGAVKE